MIFISSFKMILSKQLKAVEHPHRLPVKEGARDEIHSQVRRGNQT